MKIKKNISSGKAVREFTDREEPRAAFWKCYETVQSEIGGEADVHVLTYYGIGGIGKSRLLKKLCQEMDERLTAPVYATWDFDTFTDCRRALSSLKDQLKKRGKFTFPLLELGLYVYAKKTGENAKSPELEQLVLKNPLLNLLLDATEDIPMVGIASKILSVADRLAAYVYNYVKKNERKVYEIEYQEPEQLIRMLPNLFALDMQHNMEKATQPVVIFLDTYEQLVNEMSQVGDPLGNDAWLRGDNGPVQNVPGVLWVIAGREKLKWERFDPDWAQALEQHLLGALSQADSVGFLERSGVADSRLREQLYTLTQGTPVFLDLCVDQYERLLQRGETPEIGKFGTNSYELVERFVRYMGDAQKDHVFMLACLHSWTEGMILDLAGKILPNFSETTYRKIQGYSFVLQADEGRLCIHQTVGEVLRQECPEGIRRRTGRALTERYLPAVQDVEPVTDSFADGLLYVTRGALLQSESREELLAFYEAHLKRPLGKLIDAVRFAQAEEVLKLLTAVAEENTEDALYADILLANAENFSADGEYAKALVYRQRALELYTALFGPEHPDTLGAMNALAVTLYDLGGYEEALVLQQMVLKRRQQILGEKHPATITAMNNLANTLGALGRYEEALALQQAVLEKRQQILGEEHPDTLMAMNNLAVTLNDLGRHEEALALQQAVLEKRQQIFGTEHSATITAMNNLAITMRTMGRYMEALSLEQAVLEKRRQVLGEEHPDTLTAMSNLAYTLYQLGRYQEALILYREVLENRRRILGEAHPATIQAENNVLGIKGVLIKSQSDLKQYKTDT